MQTLFPDPISDPASDPVGPLGHGRGRDEFVLVPNASRPTLIVPRRPRRVAASALMNYKTSASARARLKLRLSSLAARLGAVDLLPRIAVPSGSGAADDSIAAYLNDVMGRQVYLALYVGVSRAVEKPIVQLIGPEGDTIGFAKIGVDAMTRALVDGEAATLAALGDHRTTTLIVPAVLHHGSWRGLSVLVQQPLQGKKSGPPSPEVRAKAQREVVESGERRSESIGPSAYVAHLRSRLDSLPASDHADLLRRALTELVEGYGSVVLERGGWHGDWAPWNMTGSPGPSDTLAVWDWEQYAPDVPVGFDTLHYRIQQLLVEDGRSAPEAVGSTTDAAAGLLAAEQDGEAAAMLVMLLYVLEIACRYLEDGEDEAGTRMGALHTWLPSTVARQLRALAVPG